MLSAAVISLMYCSIQTRKRDLTADRENNMWRYLDGVSAPPAKKKKSEAGEKQAKYEKEERRRAFLPSWQKNRPWLKFVPASLSASATSQTASAGGNMFCEICQSAFQLDRSLAQKNVFVDAGCTSLRLESIKIHETSSNHLKAIKSSTKCRCKPTCIVVMHHMMLIKKHKGFSTCSHSVAFFYL